ncbi:uncharacterized protein T551_02582 [Pneumocystis jirovecii RU7]|uniref:Ribosomal protein L22 n=1 Tax=Pneumocystis jirovecii (strain RU7) TaxID=1408657 RepID=A0A0W4ZK44_PNEJ7|nr:uncharacterized protein T551_02582 [Pneumocystis jirovecii RU7]KTW28732.1 hypothetical protein T551_02582 [Pneumocystis jirovecii RU7]
MIKVFNPFFSFCFSTIQSNFFPRYFNNLTRNVIYKKNNHHLSVVSDIFDQKLYKPPTIKETMVIYKSPNMKTSPKKLTKIAKQIAGKKLEDAILQMDFSKKKAARSVAEFLRNARVKAVNNKLDKNTLFVDQALVGKGIYIKQPWFRGKGRMSIRRRPRAHIKMIIRDITILEQRKKETQIRQKRKAVWVQIPNKPIYNKAIGFTC